MLNAVGVLERSLSCSESAGRDLWSFDSLAGSGRRVLSRWVLADEDKERQVAQNNQNSFLPRHSLQTPSDKRNCPVRDTGRDMPSCTLEIGGVLLNGTLKNGRVQTGARHATSTRKRKQESKTSSVSPAAWKKDSCSLRRDCGRGASPVRWKEPHRFACG